VSINTSTVTVPWILAIFATRGYSGEEGRDFTLMLSCAETDGELAQLMRPGMMIAKVLFKSPPINLDDA